ncbi:uncharacterized protein [Venturia canescens]|uniref:uncharacterized protein n=1 Tax=Venturia canescens TaxID=32260 RepID=UPI001C9C0CD9|nr:uncharacterized protein LOC122412777 [Venturia canescens]
MQLGRKEAVRMTRTSIFIILTMSALSITTSLGAPFAYDPQLEMKPSSWQDNSLTPIVSEPCSSSGCWGWLSPLPINRVSNEILREKTNDAKLEDQPQPGGESNSPAYPWKPNSGVFVPRGKSSPSNVRQMSPRPVKKDVFMSRSWGPGGLPFSVLYMNPHGVRASSYRPSTGYSEVVPTKAMPEPDARRSYEGVPAAMNPTKHPNYRVAVRNGSTGQPRRQYSIIPQLFISYGWGPLGK